MNICFVHEEYPEETNFGGIAIYQKVTAEELVKQGNKVYVICRGIDEDKVYVENGVNIYRIYVPRTNKQINDYVEYRTKVAKLLNTFQESKLIDIIETPDWGAETVYFEQNRKIPLVVRLHTPLKVWLKYNKNNFGEITELLLKWEEKMLKSANLITCCSNALKNIIVDDFDINSSRILVTPNPANITNFYRDNNIKKENKLVFVGSLEERKGVCVLAKALNIVFNSYPNLTIQFIGKDTNRNNNDISTKELIYKILDNKYANNISFIGQIPNNELNYYLNTSRVGIFPSLFDNFPYVVLESMATGLHIIGSKNSGMVEMLNDNLSIYNTGDEKDLAKKIIQKYEFSLNNEINNNNIKRVYQLYNPSKVCHELISIYESTVNEYNSKKVSLDELQQVLNNICNDEIITYNREKSGVANLVFKVTSKTNKKYIIKKYLYKYNFSLSNELYRKYDKANIKCIKPINNDVITYNSYNYNIFEYIKNKHTNINKINLFEKLMSCERSTKFEPTLQNKCEKFYLYILEHNNFEGITNEEVNYVTDIFSKIKDIKIIQEKYLNHGDISESNILTTQNNSYIIDFDEVTVTTPLYDFAVIVIKNFVKNGRLNFELYYQFKEKIKYYFRNYDDIDFENIIRYYLCKILIEKFYLHIRKQINLFDAEQIKDDYKKYLKILKDIDSRTNMERNYEFK